MTARLDAMKAVIPDHATAALEAIETLRGAMGHLDKLLYEARYPASDEDLDPGFNTESPYRAIGEAYENLSELSMALRQLREETK